MTNPKIIFMGTPEFSVPTLKALNDEFGVAAVVTVPDKPKGRGRKVKPSPVKKAAEELGINVLQPSSLKDPEFIEQLESYEPDIFCVVAFRILPEEVFSIPKIASFNIHASLLPKYRGAAPINWAIINGEEETGVTSFILEKKVDTGNVIAQKKTAIEENMTVGELHDKLMPLSAELAVETVQKLAEGNYTLKEQSDSEATPAPKIFRKDCEINWNQDAEKVKNFINGMSPIPGAWSNFDNKTTKFLKAEVSDKINSEAESYLIENDKLKIQTTTKSVKILKIQPEGKKAMKIEDFLKGFRGEKKGKIK